MTLAPFWNSRSRTRVSCGIIALSASTWNCCQVPRPTTGRRSPLEGISRRSSGPEEKLSTGLSAAASQGAAPSAAAVMPSVWRRL